MAKPQSSKAKGRRFQQKVRDKILETYPSLTLEDVRSTGMGQGGEDIQLSPLARSLFPYSVECKKHKTFAIYGPYEQCKYNAPNGATPIVFLEGDRKQPLALLSMEDFFNLLE